MTRFAALTLSVLLALCVASFAKDNPERTQVGREIHVGTTETAGELTCFACSIYVRGRVNGDATTFGGRIVVEEGGSISGDATSFGGDLRVQAGASVRGDATSFGGHVVRDQQGTVGGDVASFGGVGGLLLVVVLPLVFLAGIVALIVWLLRRNRPANTPVYSGVASTRL
jgi:hypothetical protein